MSVLQNYKRLARVLDEEDEEYSNHSAIVTPKSYDSSRFEGAIVHMIGNFSKMNKILDAQQRQI